MSRPLLLASVALAGYAVMSSVVSLAVMRWWRTGRADRADLPPSLRARRLVRMRALPATAAATLVTVLIMPAFVMFEPVRAVEPVGPLLPVLALVGAAMIVSAAAQAAASSLGTWRLTRQWLRAAQPIDLDPPAGVPAYAVDTFTPVVALVGVVAPKLIATRAIIDACDRQELARIVAHERGHLQARDNLKRWLMACAPDLLRWTPVHDAIAMAWDDAAEDAADDAATAGLESARVDLAALLVKVARLSTGPRWTAATVSPFIERDRLDRRVRRLLAEPAGAIAGDGIAAPVATVTAVVATLATLTSPAALKALHGLVEAVIAAGR